jgi:hypothetical protein
MELNYHQNYDDKCITKTFYYDYHNDHNNDQGDDGVKDTTTKYLNKLETERILLRQNECAKLTYTTSHVMSLHTEPDAQRPSSSQSNATLKAFLLNGKGKGSTCEMPRKGNGDSSAYCGRVGKSLASFRSF